MLSESSTASKLPSIFEDARLVMLQVNTAPLTVAEFNPNMDIPCAVSSVTHIMLDTIFNRSGAGVQHIWILAVTRLSQGIFCGLMNLGGFPNRKKS